MAPITFRFSRSRNSYDLASVLIMVSVFLVLSLVGCAALVVWPLFTSTSFELNWVSWSLVVGTLLWGFLVVLQFRGTSPKHNLLQLDDDGLTYTRMGKSHHWPWADISGLRLKERWRDLVAVEFESSFRLGWAFRIPPWSSTRFAAGRTIIILPDVFEAPLADIVAKLNAYREQVLGSGFHTAKYTE